MTVSRLSRTLLISLLAVVSVLAAGGGRVLCIANTHVAFEAAGNRGGCNDVDTEGAGVAIQSTDGECVDIELASVGLEAAGHRVASSSGSIDLPPLLPLAFVGLLPEPAPRQFDVSAAALIAAPPAHLLPLRSFILLT